MKETLGVIGVLVLIVVIIVVAIFGYMALTEKLYPWWLSIQRKAVEDSKSFTDANNNMLQTYILEYSRLDTKIAASQDNEQLIRAYQAQQKAIVTQMCQEISTMKRDTVNPQTLQWLQTHGGCK